MINPTTSQKVNIGIPDNSGFGSFFSQLVIEEKRTKIANYIFQTNKKANYEYDFDDGWEHEVILKRMLPAVATNIHTVLMVDKHAHLKIVVGVWVWGTLQNPCWPYNHAEKQQRIEW